MSWKLLPLMLLLAQAPARPPDKASIQGFVLKIGTADPVSKAVVTLTRTDSRRETYSATTASGGTFAFQNLEPGQYRLSAARNGYVRSEYGARSPNRPGLTITLSAGQKLNELTIPLMPAGTIAGRIFDRDGEPLANVNIQALRYTYQDGQRVLNQVQGTRTNDLGEYRLYWLQPGQYFVSATYAGPGGQRGVAVAAIVDALGAAGIGGRGGPGGAGAIATAIGGETNAGETEDEGYIPVYYPGTTDAQSATAISLPSGVVFSGVDLTLTPVRTLRVRGQVINGQTGQPARNANITLVPRGRIGLGANLLQNFRNRNVNDQGVFEIRGAVPGSYDLVGFINDRNSMLTGRVALDIGGADVQNVSLVVSPGYSLAGRLTIDGRTAAPGTNNPDTARIRVMLRPGTGGGFQQFRGGQNAAQVQADGTFTLPSLGQDNYRLNVAGLPRNAYVRTARLGSTDVLNEGLRIDRQPNGLLDILIGTDAGTADGTVVNDKQEPSVNVPVVLVPDPARRNRSDLYRNVSTDAAGRFHIEDVPPGDYKLFAWEDVESGAWQDPDFIRQYEDRGKAVRISPSGTAMTELRVIPPQM